MKKILINLVAMFILITMFVSITSISNAAEVTETEKTKVLEFIKSNSVLSYYNYDKVENINMTIELLCEVPTKNKVTDEQRKNPEIYDMVNEMDEGRLTTKESVNEYLQKTIGITVDKLKNYEQFLKDTTTSNNKDQFYFYVITGPTNYDDYKITEVEETSTGTIQVKITAKADGTTFSNTIELVRKGDSYNFASCKTADGKNRPFTAKTSNEFNGKNIIDGYERTILEFIKSNSILSYYNYDKVGDICITADLLSQINPLYGEKVTEEQRKNSEVYDMVKTLDEGRIITRKNLNKYLQETIGTTVDKLKNYQQFIDKTTTSNNKDQFFYTVITGPDAYDDYKITEISKTANGTIQAKITAKVNDKTFSNTIELTREGEECKFISCKSADGTNRSFNTSEAFNSKGSSKEPLKPTTPTQKDDTTAKDRIPQAGTEDTTSNVIIFVILGIVVTITIATISAIAINKYKKI